MWLDTTAYDLLRNDVSHPFDRSRFKISRRPVQVGSVRPVTWLPSCLDMLIKVPDDYVQLPTPYALSSDVLSFLDRCLAFEDELIPDWRERYYLYLTIDCRSVGTALTHRNSGWHFDGMQGARYPKKLPVCHEYIVANTLPTEFSDAPTNADDLSEAEHNWFIELGAQIDRSGYQVLQAAPAIIYLISAYQHHRSQINRTGIELDRIFYRLDFSLKHQDRLGNSINPLIRYPFTFHERPLPEALRYTISDAGWRSGRQFESPIRPKFTSA